MCRNQRATEKTHSLPQMSPWGRRTILLALGVNLIFPCSVHTQLFLFCVDHVDRRSVHELSYMGNHTSTIIYIDETDGLEKFVEYYDRSLFIFSSC